jgi:FkbM family methyltransferase
MLPRHAILTGLHERGQQQLSAGNDDCWRACNVIADVSMRVKRMMRRVVEEALDIRVVRRDEVAPIFEQEHLRRFFEHFRVDCVFDVGANAGQYATMLRRQVGYAGDIVSFEPIPELAERLRQQARAERSWFIEELALDEREGRATFNVFAGSQFSSLHQTSSSAGDMFRKQTQLERRIEVRTATLARELAKYQERLGFERPFLKMDTQGHDLAVAGGAGERLREFVGLQSELAIERLYTDSATYEEALKFYRSRGFELSALVPNNLGHFPRLLEIDCIMYRV